jgi:hypothetical protein
MKSPFKFLDSYTKDDREIFFGRNPFFQEPEVFMNDNISPLQGLTVWLIMRWTASNAMVLCAYSAKENAQYSIEQEIGPIIRNFHPYSKTKLFLIRPERAKYNKTGQRPVYKTHNDNKP